jgi:hypothetical protein
LHKPPKATVLINFVRIFINQETCMCTSDPSTDREHVGEHGYRIRDILTNLSASTRLQSRRRTVHAAYATDRR